MPIFGYGGAGSDEPLSDDEHFISATLVKNVPLQSAICLKLIASAEQAEAVVAVEWLHRNRHYISSPQSSALRSPGISSPFPRAPIAISPIWML
jgi:hypothetical protein